MPRAAAITFIMATITNTTMTNMPLIRLLAWLSPALPTGGYAYSHGLLSDVLANGSGRNDAILLRYAHRSANKPALLGEIIELAQATAASRERQAESVAQGNAFAAATVAWAGASLPANMPYAVAIGALTGRHEIDEDDACAAYLQAVATNLISATVRLVPLGQNAGLRVLAALEPVILTTAAETRDATLDDLGGCVFRSDLAAMRHETQYTRLFRS
jgi:urease accessory protein